jgi:hypothetical protein
LCVNPRIPPAVKGAIADRWALKVALGLRGAVTELWALNWSSPGTLRGAPSATAAEQTHSNAAVINFIFIMILSPATSVDGLPPEIS